MTYHILHPRGGAKVPSPLWGEGQGGGGDVSAHLPYSFTRKLTSLNITPGHRSVMIGYPTMTISAPAPIAMGHATVQSGRKFP